MAIIKASPFMASISIREPVFIMGILATNLFKRCTMKKLIALVFILILTSCDKQFVRKKIVSNDITVTWYYYSYISDSSPDFVTIKKKGSRKIEIFEAKYTLVNVFLKGDSMVLKLYKPSNGIIYTKDVMPNVYGYKIVIDSSATREDYQHLPDGKY